MIRIVLTTLLALLTVPLCAQEESENVAIESIGLEPGDAVVFGFGKGYSHQLLIVRLRGDEARTAPLAPGELRAAFWSEGTGSRLEIENGTPEPLQFEALADRQGRGGFSRVPTMPVPVGQRIVAGQWAFPIVSLVLGEFSWRPHGNGAP